MQQAQQVLDVFLAGNDLKHTKETSSKTST